MRGLDAETEEDEKRGWEIRCPSFRNSHPSLDCAEVDWEVFRDVQGVKEVGEAKEGATTSVAAVKSMPTGDEVMREGAKTRAARRKAGVEEAPG